MVVAGRTADKIARIIPDRLIVFPVLRRTFAAIYKRGESRVTEQSATEVGRGRRSGKAVGKRKETRTSSPVVAPGNEWFTQVPPFLLIRRFMNLAENAASG